MLKTCHGGVAGQPGRPRARLGPAPARPRRSSPGPARPGPATLGLAPLSVRARPPRPKINFGWPVTSTPQQQRWPIDAAWLGRLTATMAHRCCCRSIDVPSLCCLSWQNSIAGPPLRFAELKCPLSWCRRLARGRPRRLARPAGQAVWADCRFCGLSGRLESRIRIARQLRGTRPGPPPTPPTPPATPPTCCAPTHPTPLRPPPAAPHPTPPISLPPPAAPPPHPLRPPPATPTTR